MDHSDIEKNNSLEKYLLHELSTGQEEKMEEHISSCKECQDTLSELKNALELMQTATRYASSDLSFGQPQLIERKTKIRFFTYTGLVIIMIPLIMYISFISLKDSQHFPAPKKFTSDTLVIDRNKPDGNPINRITAPFTGLQKFENLIDPGNKQNLLITPAQNQIFPENAHIHFDTNNYFLKKSNLMIYNNKEELIMQKKIKFPFIFTSKLNPGLYYWQVKQRDTLLYTGKFYIQ